MKVIFDFNNPEDMLDYEIYKESKNMNLALFEISNYLKEQEKYVEVKNQHSIEVVRETFWGILSNNNITHLL